jgi:hypothetical protein
MNNLASVQEFLKQCIAELGLGFHPDNDFTEYVQIDTDASVYSAEQAAERQKKLDACHEFCGPDSDYSIYDLCTELPEYQALLNQIDYHDGYDPELAAMGAYTT